MKFLPLSLLLLIFNLSVAQEYSQRYKLVNLGRDVNTAYHEGAPVVSADGKTLYFFVHNHPLNTYGKEGSQDIWFAQMGEGGKWGKAQHLDKPLNEHKANQVFTVLPDNETLFIRGGSSKNKEGFSFTHKEGSSWSKPEAIDIEGFKDMHKGKFYGATVSSDREHMVLYFSEKEKGTFSDLYVSNHIAGDEWSRPVKLDNTINTGRDEFAPFLAPDNKTLYYSSNRKDMGVGGSDIYKVTRLDETWLKWSAPENVGRPLNTRAFDAYMSVDNNNNVFTTQSGSTIDGGNLDIFWLQLKDIKIRIKGLVLDQKTEESISNAEMTFTKGDNILDTLSSDDDGAYALILSEGNDDFIFNVSAFDYQPGYAEITLGEIVHDTTIVKDIYLQPVEKDVLLSGIIYDEKTNDAIEASIEITRIENNTPRKRNTNDAGFYEVVLPSTGYYRVTAKAEGYLNGVDSIVHEDEAQLAYTLDLYLKPIEVGTTVRLNNIFFDFDKTTLKSESFEELDKVVTFLNENSSLEIEISGHTDSKGADDYNLNLSQGRAQSVVDYLISEGIDDYRLIAKGYGETVPVDTNETDEGRAINRRVEFKVLKIDQ